MNDLSIDYHLLIQNHCGIIMSLKDKSLRIRNKRILSEVEELMIKGEYLTALDKIETIEMQYLEEEEQSKCQAIEGVYFTSKGDFQKATEIAQGILQKGENNPKYKDSVLIAYVVSGNIRFLTGKLDEGMKFCDQADKIILTMDSSLRFVKSMKAHNLTIRGTIYLQSGDLKQGLDILLRCVPLFEELKKYRSLISIYNNIGECYRLMGKLEQALHYFKLIQDIEEKEGIETTCGATQGNIGVILFQQGFFVEAVDILDRSIDFLENQGHKTYQISMLFFAAMIAIEQDKREKAKILIQRMENIDESENTLFTSQHYRAAKALLFKRSQNAENHEKARELFEEVVEEEVSYIEVSLISLLNLCDILLVDLRNSDNEEILNKILEYVEIAQEIAVDQGLSWFRAETFWLQSQISLIDLDYEKARILLNQAQHIAEQDGLHQLAMRISSEYDALLEEQDIWAELRKEKAPYSERVKATNIDDHVERMAKLQEAEEVVSVNEEPVQFMLIAAHGGYSVVSKEFQEGFKVDESLVSGFLSALTSFSDEVFSQPLDRVKVGEYILLLRAELPFLFCYVFKGESYSAMQKVNQLIETLRNDTATWMKLERTIETGAVDSHATQEVSRLVTHLFQSAA